MPEGNDIEDVLSSIRRLVAEEVSEATDPMPGPATAALVLDPAQRVADPEDPFRAIPPLPDEAPADSSDDAEAPLALPAPLILPRIEPATDAPEDEADSDEVRESAPKDILSDLSSASVDDEALRDLIAEIVRQELAGALGERITRNVRKLVRRELRQMMSGDEFD